MKKIYLLLFIISSLFIFSCRKNTNNQTNEQNKPTEYDPKLNNTIDLTDQSKFKDFAKFMHERVHQLNMPSNYEFTSAMYGKMNLTINKEMDREVRDVVYTADFYQQNDVLLQGFFLKENIVSKDLVYDYLANVYRLYDSQLKATYYESHSSTTNVEGIEP